MNAHGGSSTALGEVHAALFPGVPYTQERNATLASRLRELAGQLENGGIPEQEGAGSSSPTPAPATGKRAKKSGDLDFSACERRLVALELLYEGHAYDGFARQESSPRTVEAELFAALERTRLIPRNESWQELLYSRCGRTDRGVSALGQVIALRLRSVARAGCPLPDFNDELDYPALLNRVLPDDIRITGWAAPVDPGFSARFSASERAYKYYVLTEEEDNKGGAGLDVEAMRAAAAFFIGPHDFRNFCKMDVAQVSHFRREVLDFRIEERGLLPGGRRLLVLSLRGTAFLWHQVRCMAAVLLMVGRGLEPPDIVAQLLDVAAHPAKPLYTLAPEQPLLLAACTYPDGEVEFQRSVAARGATAELLRKRLDGHLTHAALLAEMLGAVQGAACSGLGAAKQRAPSQHVPLLRRVTEPTMEERQAKLLAAGKSLPGQEP